MSRDDSKGRVIPRGWNLFPDRDASIWRAVKDGMTYTKAGAIFGISRQRAQQIYAREERARQGEGS